MPTEIRIPFENITRQYEQIKEEIGAAIAEVLPTGRYVMGAQLTAFEAEFAAYHQASFCAGISNGTEALHLALLACGVGPGDEVITVPNTYVATVFAISYTGATPVFVDVDPRTFNIDPADVEKKITPRTRAILPVHLYGQCVDMDSLMEIARRHNLYVVEDAAHAHGALYKDRKAGSLGHIACFSFYPTKVMGAYGDGGAVTTSDPILYDRVRVLRYMGQHKNMSTRSLDTSSGWAKSRLACCALSCATWMHGSTCAAGGPHSTVRACGARRSHRLSRPKKCAMSIICTQFSLLAGMNFRLTWQSMVLAANRSTHWKYLSSPLMPAWDTKKGIFRWLTAR